MMMYSRICTTTTTGAGIRFCLPPLLLKLSLRRSAGTTTTGCHNFSHNCRVTSVVGSTKLINSTATIAAAARTTTTDTTTVSANRITNTNTNNTTAIYHHPISVAFRYIGTPTATVLAVRPFTTTTTTTATSVGYTNINSNSYSNMYRRMRTMTTHWSSSLFNLPTTNPPMGVVWKRTLAVKTNSGKHGRGLQGWFKKPKKRPLKVDSKDPTRGGNIKYDNKTNNIIKLQICHNEYDTFVIEPDENDKLFYSRTKFTVKNIQEKINEVYTDYDTSNIVEYYDRDVSTWKPLIHINDILKYRGGNIPFQIRLPQHYDDTPLPPHYLDAVGRNHNMNNDNDIDAMNNVVATADRIAFQTSLIGTTIQAMVILLKYEGYVRSDIKQYVLVHPMRGDLEISTQLYILQRANLDPDLQSILLNNVNALTHMVELIHYDFVWNKL